MGLTQHLLVAGGLSARFGGCSMDLQNVPRNVPVGSVLSISGLGCLSGRSVTTNGCSARTSSSRVLCVWVYIN